jgi:hypothetical protein
VIFNQYGQRNEEDRREVSPPVKVESAPPGHQEASLTTGSRNATSGGVAYAVRTVTKFGSVRPIFALKKRREPLLTNGPL